MGIFFYNKKGLLKAARTGRYEDLSAHLDALVPQKLNIDTPDEQGNTALSLAVAGGHARAVALLLSRGANPNVQDAEGLSPLMASAEKPEIALALIAAGALPDTHNKDYVYPLHLAAFNGELDVVKALVNAKADLNVMIRTNGRTALHWAVEKEMAGVIDCLVKAGARTDIADKSGKTAADLARAKPHLLKILNGAASAAPAAARDEWTLSGPQRLSHTGVYPDISRRITEIFNFESRERITVSENLKTGAEQLTPPESFDAISEDALRRALAEFRRLGGTADDDAVIGNRGDKKKFRL